VRIAEVGGEELAAAGASACVPDDKLSYLV